jgi:aspartyl-tRNA(Asn)/glutamyl-tRNA(Gln) amidotransferase subunit A
MTAMLSKQARADVSTAGAIAFATTPSRAPPKGVACAGPTVTRAATPDPTSLPAHVLGERIARRQLSPVDLVEGFLARIRSMNERLHALVDVYEDDARLAAEAADKAIRSGHWIGPLHGVPVVLKDVIDLEGRIVTGGSMTRLDRRARRTARLARRLIEQGAIVLAKAHTVEFALGAWGTNEHLGTPWNPWNLTVHHAPGGSSSGSAVAVAAGLAPWAIGTDTGGSVRIPAALCGVVGLKPTHGVINSEGVLPLSPTFDTPGPIARSVEDAALLFTAMRDPPARSSRDLLRDLRLGIAGLRLGRLPPAECEETAPDLLLAYHAALEVLAKAGARIVDVALPRSLSDYTAKTKTIIVAESFALYGDLAADPSLLLDPRVRAQLLVGASVSASEYLAAIYSRTAWREEFAGVFENVDALLTPATRTPALPLEKLDHKRAPMTFTRFVNFLQLCAVVVPDGFTREGLPSSLQIVCREHDEATALRIAWAYQNATEWHERRPPLAPDGSTQPHGRPQGTNL